MDIEATLTIAPPLLLEPTELFFGRDAFPIALSRFCARWSGPIAWVVDRSVLAYVRPVAEQSCASLILEAPPKHRQGLDELLDQLLHHKLGRDTLLVGVGGGAVSDLVGFTASLYLRGVAYVLVPTTLLAMVDASIGGKTGIDLPQGKNLLGALYPPRAIFADPRFLDTLPPHEILFGSVEMLKLGLTADRELWEQAQRAPSAEPTVLRAIRAKATIATLDPREEGLRHILNFGHTVGHALEKVSHYTLAHGAAVGIGCAVESRLSALLGYLSDISCQKIQQVFDRMNFRLPGTYTRPDFLAALALDKKRRSGRTRFVFIEEIGHPVAFEGQYCAEAPVEALDAAIAWMEAQYG